jgi:Uma2 family endonuclease
MSATRIVLNYEDYAALPADGRRYELHEGELSVTPAPTPRHQMILTNLLVILRRHVDGHAAGLVLPSPLDVILNPPDATTVLQPDLVYLDPARRQTVTDRGIEGPPTLVVEIVSPSTVMLDRRTKFTLYAKYGVPYCWLVDPEARALEAFALGPEGYTLALRASGPAAVSPPPFAELALVPDALWA